MPDTENTTGSLLQRLRFWRNLSIGLSACLLAAVAAITREQWLPLQNRLAVMRKTADQQPPHYRRILELVSRLSYSGTASLMRPEVHVSIDFEGKQWSLRNVHRFSKEGELLLDDGRFGLCGELAAYAYQKIRPLLEQHYQIEFLQVAQSSYFPAPRAGHYALRITDTASAHPRVFILDPSFDRYGPPEEFEDYLFFEPLAMLDFMENRNPDITFQVGEGSPILINRQLLVTLAVEGRQGRFDRDNFRLSLVARRRYNYASRPVYLLGRINGRKDAYEDAQLAAAVLDAATYGQIRARMNEWFAGF